MNTARWLARRGLSLFFALAAAATAFAQSAPVISTQPANLTVAIGSPATFTVVVSIGTASPTYQWRKNSVPITGATNASYTIASALVGDSGLYSVVVTNGGGSTTSFGATLSVVTPAVVGVTGPGGVAAGQTATFTAGTTGGSPPFSYQWFKNGTLAANLITGATGAVYVTPPTNIDVDNNSIFYVRVTDASGIVVFSAGTSLAVFKATQTIIFNGPNNPVVSTVPVTLTATASSGLPITFSVVSGSALVSGSTVTFQGVGSVTLRATQVGNNSFDPATADRIVNVSKGVPIITWAQPGAVADGTVLSGTQLNASADVSGLFDYSPQGGTVMRIPSQTVTVNFTPFDFINYDNTSAVRVIAVVNVPAVTGPTSLTAGQSAQFSVSTSGLTAPFTYQWYKNGDLPANAIAGATSATYVISAVTVDGENNTFYTVKITDGNGSVITAIPVTLMVGKGSQTIAFNAPANPVVSATPVALTATASSGLPVTLAVVAGTAGLSGTNLTLSTAGSVTVRATQAGNSNYDAAPTVDRTFTVARATPVITWATPGVVEDGTTLGAAQLNASANVPGTFDYSPAGGTIVRAPSQILTATFNPTDAANYNSASAQRTLVINPAVINARLANVSVRTTLTAAQTLIVGFTMQGGAKSVLARAVGPGLTQFGVAGVMADPRITLFKDTALLEANDNWGGGAALVSAFANVGAFGLAGTSLDAALLRSMDGGHTVQVVGPAGIVLVEVYDAGAGLSPRLTNVSARNRVGTGGDIMIAGFNIAGTGGKNLLIRAVGPTLATFGVTGTLNDPKLEIFSGATKVAENDSWNVTLAPAFASVGAFALTTGSRDAALIIALQPGSYTVQVSGADGGTGEAIVEIYELP